MEGIRYAWSFIRKYKRRYICGLLILVLTSACAVINPRLAGLIVDRVIMPPEHDFTLLLQLLGILSAVTLARSCLRYLQQNLTETVSQGVLFDARTRMYEKLQSLDFGYFDKNRTGDIMTKMTQDLELLRYCPNLFVSCVDNVIVFIAGVATMISMDWRLGLCQLAILPLFFLIEKKFAATVRPTFMAIREQFSKLNTVVQENISGNRVVKAFAKEEYELKKFADANDAYYRANINSAKVWRTFLPIIIVSGGLFTVVLYLVGGRFVIDGKMTMGGLVMANSLLWMISGPVSASGWLINDWQRVMASINKIKEMLEEQPAIVTPDNAVDNVRITGKVEFKNVYFRYDRPPTLKNISFTAYPGQTIAIVGKSGSGKSTLINLISRFYDATAGEVFIDDVNIRDIAVKRLREAVAIAQQDIFLFSDTIEGNIAYGVPSATMEDVERVAKIADAHDFILRMPEGYDTIVGERGVGLSGGQKQRIALARALLRNPSILILDDTTSAVDMETEHGIFTTLRQYYSNRTTFIIAHRISSVKDANLILVLDDGVVIERGTHEQLLAQRGSYYNVYVNQYGDFNTTEGGKPSILDRADQLEEVTV